MKTLIITDLARTDNLDRAAMAAVRGGWKMSSLTYPPGDYSYAPKFDSSLHASQNLTQAQSVLNSTANGSAFLSGVHANNNTTQNGSNNIVAL